MVNRLQNKSKEAFIKARYEYELGHVCEFDWGEAKLSNNGKMAKIQLSVFTTAAGSYRHAIAFLKQDTPCFLESHAEFVEHMGNVYKPMVYDNTRVAVKKLQERKVNQLMLYSSFHFIMASTSDFVISTPVMRKAMLNVVWITLGEKHSPSKVNLIHLKK